MKFWFCESCGKRLTEQDLDAGQGRDKKLKGVFCKSCAVGVLTMENLPLTKAAAREILAQAEPSGKEVPLRRAASIDRVSATGHGKSEPPAAPASSRGKAGVGATHAKPQKIWLIMLSIIAGLGLFAFLFLGGSSPKATKAATMPPSASSATSTDPEPKVNQPAAAPKPLNSPNAEPPQLQPANPEFPKPKAAEVPSVEDQAQLAFSKVSRFAGLAEDDHAGKIAQLEAFVKEYGNSLTAARALDLISSLKRKAASSIPAIPASLPAPQSPSSQEKPPVAAAPVNEAAAGGAAYAAFTEEYLTLLRKRNRAGAAVRLERAGTDPLLKPFSLQLEQDRKLLHWLDDLEGALPRGLEKLKALDDFEFNLSRGEPMRIGKRAQYQLLEIKSDSIQLGSKGMELTVTLAKIRDDTRAKLIDLGLGADAAGMLRKAFQALLNPVGGDGSFPVAEVKAKLERAKNVGAPAEEIELLSSKLESAARGAQERFAEQELERFDQLLAARDWAVAERLGLRLLAEYSTSSAVTKRPDLKDRVSTAKHKGVPLQEYSITLQEGAAIPELGVEKYSGTNDSHIYGHTGKDDYPRSADFLMAGETGGWPMLGFAIFQQEGGPLPDDTEILQARVGLNLLNELDPILEFHRVLRAWKAKEVTWLSASKGSPWKTPGGEWSKTIAASFHADKTTPWCYLDVTESLKEAQKEGKNFGWILRVADTEDGFYSNIVRFASSRRADATIRPKLELKIRCPQLKNNK